MNAILLPQTEERLKQILRNARHAEFIRLRAERRAAKRNAKHDARFNPIRFSARAAVHGAVTL